MTQKFVVVGQTDCKWCDKALHHLEIYRQQYVYLDIKSYPDLASLLTYFDLDTVPQIFQVGNNSLKWIGGYTELQAMELE